MNCMLRNTNYYVAEMKQEAAGDIDRLFSCIKKSQKGTFSAVEEQNH